MHKFIIKRLLSMILVLIGAAFIVFFLVKMKPGDAAAIIAKDAPESVLIEVREEYGLNDPVIVQFARYFVNMFQGNLGVSYFSKESVISSFMNKLPFTFYFAIPSILFSTVVGLLTGMLSAVKQYSFGDRITMFLALLGVSMPTFWVGLILISIFSLKLGWLPSVGLGSWKHVILPALVCSLSQISFIARNTRSAMLDVLRQDYIRTARAKGLKERDVIFKHARKNAMIPIVTAIGIQFGYTIGGAVMTETIFAIAGVGRTIVDSINNSDEPMIIGFVILVTFLITLFNIGIDIVYAYIDPRIKAQYERSK